MLLGKDRVVKVYGHFSSGQRHWSKGGSVSSPICEKFYANDGLHPNTTGSRLLGALISKTIAKASQKANPDTFTKEQKQSEAVCQASPQSAAKTHQPMSAGRCINFTETCAPPPLIDNLNHFPHLTEPKIGTDSLQKDGHRCETMAILAGYSDAVKKPVTDKVNQSTSLKTRRKKTCKLLKIL